MIGRAWRGPAEEWIEEPAIGAAQSDPGDAGGGPIDGIAGAELLDRVYDELRALARSQLSRERVGATLQPTALVHEAWLRLGGGRFDDRRHFLGAAARAMRRILVERARRRARLRHGGGRERVEVDVDAEVAAFPEPKEDVLALTDALERLEAADPRKAEIVHLRYFLGLTIEETAETLKIAPTTVKDDWTYARAWLKRAIDGGPRREDS